MLILGVKIGQFGYNFLRKISCNKTKQILENKVDFSKDKCNSHNIANMQIIRSSYKVASDWLGRTMKNNAILKIQYGGYGGRRDVGEKGIAQALNFEK